ncbi:MAG TPA: large conductance mechanosensitive channel protein MscL [Candidatus Saccharimonadales bacterium]|jgi:large conductance mechanosensitive channel|nr:large conductance mechanosensitive channel protein MscL [Candidatus Saccharimonadales bacterium]
MFKEFKKFILRGNVVDLAVAVVIGAAFNSVVQAFVKDIITPIVAIFYGGKESEFAARSFTVHGSTFLYGDFVNTAVSFLLIALVVFFLVVQPINRLISLAKRDDKTEEPTTKKCPACLSEINIKATRCAFCTTKLEDTKS